MDYQNYDDIFTVSNYPEFRYTNNKDGILSKYYSIIPKEYTKCLCMSGNKFKFCCRDKLVNLRKDIDNNKIKLSIYDIYNQDPKKILSRNIENKSIGKKKISYCFAKKICNDCDTENYNTRSHTMSKGNVLKNLSESHVVGFNDHKLENELCLDNVSDFFKTIKINEASTTVSFCKKHDEYLFEEIEQTGKTNYQGNYIEDLEYALKSITYDIYYRIWRIKYLSELFSNHVGCANDRFMIDFKDNIDTLFDLYSKANKIIEDIIYYKKDNKISGEFIRHSIKLPAQKINYSISECIKDKNGTYHFVNIVNIPEPYILVSYYNESKLSLFDNRLKKYKNNIWNKEKIVDFFDFSITSTQNIFFNKMAFEKLSKLSKYYLYKTHRYYDGIYNLDDDTIEDLKNTLFENLNYN